jgi:hypothetical protein
MAVTQYIGARYVPKFNDPMEWNSTNTYEPLTVVLHEGNSYTSKQSVPVGIDIANTDYWAETGNYNAQIAQYKTEVDSLKESVSANTTSNTNQDAQLAGTTDSGLKTLLTNERTERVNKDTALDAQLAGTTDSGLKTLITNESTARGNKDTALDAQIAGTADSGLKTLIDIFVPKSNPIYYGADPTGAIDSAKAINDCIAANKTTVFSPGTYKIETPIVTDYITDNRKSIDFNGAVITCDFTDFALQIGYLNYTNELATNGGSSSKIISYFKNCTINCINAAGCGIKVMPHYMGATFENFIVNANKYGLYSGDNSGATSYPCGTAVLNCNFSALTRSNTLENSAGLTFKDTDEIISETSSNYYDIGIDDNTGGNLNIIHILGNRDINFTSGIAIRNNGSATLYENIYIDTYKTAIKATSNCNAVLINNLFDYAWSTITEHNVFDFSEPSNFIYNINNCHIDFNNQNNLKLLIPPKTVAWPQMLYGSKLTNVMFSGNFSVNTSNTDTPNPEYLYIDAAPIINQIKQNMYITSKLQNAYSASTIEFTTSKHNKFGLNIEIFDSKSAPTITYFPIKINSSTQAIFSYEYEWTDTYTCLIKIFLKSYDAATFGSFSNINNIRCNCIETAPFACGYNPANVATPSINEMGTVTCTMSA